MKRAALIFAFALIAFISAAQNDYSDVRAKQMLKDFYTAYIAAMNSRLQPTALESKLELLRDKYCTKALYKKLNRSNPDNDQLIAGDGYTTTDILNKTLNIAKDPTTENEFVISYISHVQQIDKPTDLKIILQLKVVKESDGYKIASVSVM